MKSNALQGKDLISMDIGTHSTKIVIGKQEKNTLVLSQALTIATPPDTFYDGFISNINRMKEAVEPVIKNNKIKAKHTLCTLESTSIITREVTMPMVKPEQMKKMLGFEIQQYLPIEIEQYVIQYKLLEEFEEENTKKVNVLVTALPKNIAEKYLELIESLHLKPVALDIHSNGVDKLFNSSIKVNGGEPLIEKTVAIIDLGYHFTNITIKEHGHFKFNRLLSTGGKEIDTNIGIFLNISKEEAEKKKFQIKNTSDREVAVSMDYVSLKKDTENENIENADEHVTSLRISNIVKTSINNWVDDIERIFKYYTTRNTGNIIDAVYIYGGSSNLVGLADYLQESFNIPTFKVTTLSNINTDNLNGSFDLSSYVNAIGVMIRR